MKVGKPLHDDELIHDPIGKRILDAVPEGACVVVFMDDTSRMLVTQHSGVVVPFTPEWRALVSVALFHPSNMEALASVCERLGDVHTHLEKVEVPDPKGLN